MYLLRSMLAALSIWSSFVSAVFAQTGLEEPLYPTSYAQCTALGDAYMTHAKQLEERNRRLPIRGPQVSVGPCCMKWTNSNTSWCTTSQSKALQTEEWYCIINQGKDAVARCQDRVRASQKRGEKPKSVASCDDLLRIRNERLPAIWNQAVREHTGFSNALELGRKVQKDIQRRILQADIAVYAAILLKATNSTLQTMAALACVPLEKIEKTACSIHRASGAVQDAIAMASEEDVKKRAAIVVKFVANEIAATNKIGQVLVPLKQFVEEALEGKKMEDEYLEIRTHIGAQLTALDARLVEANTRLRSAETRLRAVDQISREIDMQCGNVGNGGSERLP